MSNITETIEEARAQAEAAGCKVVQGHDTVLLMDFDTVDSVAHFFSMRTKFEELFKIIDEQWWNSRSGNTHAALILDKPLPAAQRVALQAALGSDQWREMFAVRRLVLGVVEPCLLFRPKANPIYASYEFLEQARKQKALADLIRS